MLVNGKHYEPNQDCRVIYLYFSSTPVSTGRRNQTSVVMSVMYPRQSVALSGVELNWPPAMTPSGDLVS
jgi:hypothetical protein